MIRNCYGSASQLFTRSLSLITKMSFNNSILPSVKNPNLIFDSSKYRITLLPRYPTIYLKKFPNSQKISITVNNSIVLAIMFNEKTPAKKDSKQDNVKIKKYCSLKFHQASLLNLVSMKSGKQIQIEALSRNNQIRQPIKNILKVKDIPQQKLVRFILSQGRESIKKQIQKIKIQKIQTEMNYSEYRIFHKIIQQSLVEFSGWKLNMQFEKSQQLGRIQAQIDSDREIQELFKHS